MAFVTGEVVPDPHGSRTYMVVFKQSGVVIARWQVHSIQEGEAQIVESLRGLQKKAEENE